MAASIRDQILLRVEEWNNEGKEICLQELSTMRIAAVPTLNKYINELIDDGLLRWEAEQTDHGTRKNLYVAHQNANDQLMRRLVYELSRVADNMAKLAGEEPRGRGPRRSSGKYRQQRLKR